ncbi:hypothetical protein KKB18_13070, partial [bacterium]|nr:hypothetical protein [bacterium]
MKKSTLPIIFLVFSSLLISLNAEVSDKTNIGYVLPKDKMSVDGEKLRSVGFEAARFINGLTSPIIPERALPYQTEESYGNYLLLKTPDDGLTEKGKKAVEISPAWLRHDLADLFKRIGAKQDRWADLIIAHEG